MGDTVGEWLGNSDAKIDQEKFSNPAYDELRPRILAVIDKYIKERGIDAFIPEDKKPYELQSPEQQEQTRQEQENPNARVQRQAQPEKLEREGSQERRTRTRQRNDGAQQSAEGESRAVQTRENQSSDELLSTPSAATTTSAGEVSATPVTADRERELLNQLRLRQQLETSRQYQQQTALPVEQEQQQPTFYDYIRRGSNYGY